MQAKTTSQTGTGESQAIVVNRRPSDTFQLSLAAVVDGTATYTIQHTFDPPKAATQNRYKDVAPDFTDATWFDHEYMAGLTASQDGNYAFPVTGVRISITAGAGTVDLRIVD